MSLEGSHYEEACTLGQPSPSAPSGRVPPPGEGLEGNSQGTLEDTLLTGHVQAPPQGPLSGQLSIGGLEGVPVWWL